MRVICSGADGPLRFTDPGDVIVARHSDEVEAAFERIERALGDGSYVAGFFSYELGATLVPKQAPAAHSELPLFAIGAYARPSDAPEGAAGTFGVGPLVPTVSRSQYRDEIGTILASICDGDVYQVNYAVPFGFAFRGDAYALFVELAHAGNFPHAAFVETPALALVSCSPELFMRWERGRIVTKPMKGTASRADPGALTSEKNRAEHVMIVDLLRNDLHRLSADVEVERLLEVEAYPSYVTMTSTLAARLDGPLRLREALGAMFPCGSVTGAPKVTAMQSIARAERAPRGIFCGSIGYLAPDRTGSWNVAIRTASIDKQTHRGVLRIGGGIVADSRADEEWAEIETKRRFLERVTPPYALLETLLLERDGTYRNLEAHLDRLVRSADDLHVACDLRAVRAALGRQRGGPVLVRLRLAADGRLEVERRAVTVPAGPVAICWARAPLDSTEPLLRYKTTWRPWHDAAAADAEHEGCFEALLCNEKGDVCDGARTSVFVRSGSTLLTPPLSSGALSGVLRARLLESGVAREARLSREDVTCAREVYVGNSARGLLRAFLDAGSTGTAYAR